jgi:hypothetical protein
MTEVFDPPEYETCFKCTCYTTWEFFSRVWDNPRLWTVLHRKVLQDNFVNIIVTLIVAMGSGTFKNQV